MANWLSNLFSKTRGKDYKYAQMMNGYSPVFSQFGKSIYVSDVVQMCIDTIATECSKLQLKHTRTDKEGMQRIPQSELNYLLKYAPNELMTPKDFLEKIIWQLYLNYNCFIYPMYKPKGNNKVEFVGLYPLSPSSVAFLRDPSGKMFVEFQFSNGRKSTLPYSDVIHLRKKFSINDVMGGGMNGQPDNTALLKVLEINDTVLQGLEKGVKSSMQIRGIVNINTMVDDAKQEAERKKFEEAIKNNESGIMALDLKTDYIPLDIQPKFVNKNILDFLEQKVLRYYGVSLPILSGDFNDEQYQAFYEKTLEPLVIAISQAFSKALFSKNELINGHEVVAYQGNMMYLSAKTRIELMKEAGAQGLLTDDQKLALIGYAPIPGGNRRTQSLNHMDVSIINQYQLKQAEGSKKEKGAER